MSSNNSVSKIRHSYRTLIVACVFALIGLALLIVAVLQPEGVLKSFCEHAATVILVGATTTIATEFLLRRDFVRMIEENTESILSRIKLAGQEDALGLREVQRESGSIDALNHMVLESLSLIIIINDGRTWVSNNSTRLEARLRDPKKKTTVVLLHPDTKVVELQAIKESVDPDSIRGKIRQTVAILKELGRSGGELTVLGHDLYNPQSVYIGDDQAVVTPYFTAPGRKPIPAFIFRNTGDGSHFAYLREDARQVVLRAKAIEVA